MSNVFAISALSGLTEDEHMLVNKLLRQLEYCVTRNKVKKAYYEGTARIRDLGIAIPPALKDVETVVSWPETVVDVLDERINLQGFDQATETDELGIAEIVSENHLVEEAPQCHLDALIYGVSFIAVGTGAEGEPDPLVTFESPMSTTGDYSLRARRLTSALTWDWDEEQGRARAVTLYLPEETIVAARATNETAWRVESRDYHGLGRVPMVRNVNRPRSSNKLGRSEITRAIRAYTDNAVRTLLGMEVAREFYAAPQRYILGASEEAFVDAKGQPRTQWETYLGRVWGVDAGDNEDGTQRKIEVGQFSASSMTPYAEQVKLLSGMVSAAAGFPATYLGFISDNPPSAEGVRALEARLIKRAERRNQTFGAREVEAIELALRIRDGVWPKAGQIVAIYGNPATPTQAATTDAVTKQITAGAIPARSEVALRALGYGPAEIASIMATPANDALTAAMDALSRGQA